jgi:hypothetical protein
MSGFARDLQYSKGGGERDCTDSEDGNINRFDGRFHVFFQTNPMASNFLLSEAEP